MCCSPSSTRLRRVETSHAPVNTAAAPPLRGGCDASEAIAEGGTIRGGGWLQIEGEMVLFDHEMRTKRSERPKPNGPRVLPDLRCTPK